MSKYFFLSSLAIFSAISLVISSCNHTQTGTTISDLGQSSISSSTQPVSVQASPNELSTAPEEKIQFTCASTFNNKLQKKVPTTVAWKSSDKRAIVQWVKPMDDYWTPERRCSEISQRMQAAHDAGTLKYLTNGKMNGQKVICTAIEVKGDCKNLLMTLRPQDKSDDFLTELKDLFNGRSQSVVDHVFGERKLYVKVDLEQMWKNARQVK
jgi:Circadian oscillating protein COP23